MRERVCSDLCVCVHRSIYIHYSHTLLTLQREGARTFCFLFTRRRDGHLPECHQRRETGRTPPTSVSAAPNDERRDGHPPRPLVSTTRHARVVHDAATVRAIRYIERQSGTVRANRKRRAFGRASFASRLSSRCSHRERAPSAGRPLCACKDSTDERMLHARTQQRRDGHTGKSPQKSSYSAAFVVGSDSSCCATCLPSSLATCPCSCPPSLSMLASISLIPVPSACHRRAIDDMHNAVGSSYANL